MTRAALALAALAASLAAGGARSTAEHTYTHASVCLAADHGKEALTCFEYMNLQDHHVAHLEMMEDRGTDRKIKFQWTVTVDIDVDGVPKIRLEHVVGSRGLPFCANGKDNEVVKVLDDNCGDESTDWTMEDLGKRHGVPAFRLKTSDGACLVPDYNNLYHKGGTKYYFKLSSACEDSESVWELIDHDLETPTTGPSASPSSAPTPAPTSDAPPAGIPEFENKLFLLKERSRISGEMLGLGISFGHEDFSVTAGDVLQVKSFAKNTNKSEKHEEKMIWTLTKEGMLYLSQDPTLVLADMQGIYNVPHKPGRASVHDQVEMVSAPINDTHLINNGASWELNPRNGGYQIRLRNKHTEFGTYFCLSVAACYPEWQEDKNRTWCRKDKSNDLACSSTAECDELEPVHRSSKTQRRLEAGAYIKISVCDPDYDEVQLFVMKDPSELSDSTFSPSESPTASPEVSHTLSPSASPTVKSTGRPTASPVAQPTPKVHKEHLGSAEEESDSIKSLGLALILLLICSMLVVCMLVLVKRRRKRWRNPQRGLGDFDEQGGDEDDDDQEFFNSFQSDGLYSRPLKSAASGTSGSDEVGRFGLSERNKPQRQSSVSFDPHVTHFEQEQGFVARV